MMAAECRTNTGMATPEQTNPESLKAIGDRLRRTRLAMKMQQATWCRYVGIEPPAWNNFEKGIRRISVDNALKVCRATGVSLDWIYRGMSAQLPLNLATELQAPEPQERTRRR